MSDVRSIHELCCPFSASIGAVGSGDLCKYYADLIARAISLLIASHLDLDDVLLEHGAWLSDAADHNTVETAVTLSNLSDPASWVMAYNVARRDAGLPPCKPASTRFCRLRLTVLRELDSPLPDFRVQDDLR